MGSTAQLQYYRQDWSRPFSQHYQTKPSFFRTLISAMVKWKNRRAKNGKQGEISLPSEHVKTSYELSEGAMERPSQQAQGASGPAFAYSEGVIPPRGEKSGTSIARQNQQTSDKKIEESSSHSCTCQSHSVEPAEDRQLQKLQPQKKTDAPVPNPELEDEKTALVHKSRHFQRQDSVDGVNTARIIQLHDTEVAQINRQRQSRSPSRRDGAESAREPSPPNSGKRHKIKETLRQHLYPGSHEKKTSSRGRRLEKGPRDRARIEDGKDEQKQLPPDPPRTPTAQRNADTLQSRPGPLQIRSDVSPARQDTSHRTPGTAGQKLDPSNTGARRDQGSPSVQYSTRPIESADTHAWEKHLPQSADDATIKHEVLTLFEFIEHHVEGYYCDVEKEISQASATQLACLQSPYLPYEVPLQELLEQARYQGPIIKHCLINLVVSGISFDKSPICSLLPEEFTALPRAIRNSTVETRKKPYHDQALSQFRTLCVYLHPNVQQDAEYKTDLEETIAYAVKLCSNVFAPWEVRDQPSESRIGHLTSLFLKAADVGMLLFSQPSCFAFQWTPPRKAVCDSELQVWPRLLRTTNQYFEPLAKPQVIVESSSQQIGLEKAWPSSTNSGNTPRRRTQEPADVYELHGTHNTPSELPAPQTLVSGTIQSPQSHPYPFHTPTPSEQRDQDATVHSIITANQYKAYSPDAGSSDQNSRTNPPLRKPVPGAQAQYAD